ncbi:MAG: tripartite tricarboxylate transporter substrate binding protein, partial [Candidatus Bipolaricaulota bacterium]
VDIAPVNLPGAGGAVAAKKLANEPADGYNILLLSQSIILTQYTGQSGIELSDFQPVIGVAEDTSAITVPADAPYSNLQEFIDYAKANPGKVRIGNAGTGALWHIAAALFADKAGIQIKHIPYESGAAAALATAGHEVEACAVSPTEVKGLVDAGKLKILAIMSDTRYDIVPNVPTCKEAGLDLTYRVWRGVFCKAGTPPDRVKKLHDAIKSAMGEQSFISAMKTTGVPIVYRGTEDFTGQVKDDDALLKSTLQELGLLK